MLLHLPDDHGALAVQQAIVAKMAQLPAILRRTLTWDQGSEMTNHIAIAEAAQLDIYFCDPHSPVAARQQRKHQRATAAILC